MMLSPTIEDYLKTIFILENMKKYVRVRDIAQDMAVQLPTVTGMLKNLVEMSLVHHEKYEHVELTEKGKHIAQEIYNRHVTLKDFLTDILHIDEATAEKDACKMEHAVSPITLDRLTIFMQLMENCQKEKESLDNRQEIRLSAGCLEQMRNLNETTEKKK